jgi:hypothetical protein
VEVKEFVSAKAVHDVRVVYDKYEDAIYNCTGTATQTVAGITTPNCNITPFNNWRGIKSAWPGKTEARKRLASMSEGDQGDACRISLSQPYFIFAILLIWTLRCMLEMRKTWELAMNCFMLPRVPDMETIIDRETRQDKDEDSDGIQSDHEVTLGVNIVGLTLWLKAILVLFSFIRFALACVLLFLGARWLLATNRFADLILNAIALEFIMDLKELLYAALVPTRNKLDLSLTTVKPAYKKMQPGCGAFLSTLAILLVACLVVFLYMVYFQQVLPDYQWDVKEVCSAWISERFCVTAACTKPKTIR